MFGDGRGVFLICCCLFGVLAVSILWNDLKKDEEELEEFSGELKMIVAEQEKEKEEVRNRVVGWVQEFTGEDAAYLFQENDGYLHVAKAGKELYKVKYDRDSEVILYVLHKGEVVYER